MIAGPKDTKKQFNLKLAPNLQITPGEVERGQY